MLVKKILLSFLFPTIVLCGEKNLSGNLRNDLLSSFSDSTIVSNTVVVEVQGKKNPMVNGLFSLFIPGAGQFNTERYTKSAIFISAEIATVAAALIYGKKGDDKTAEFQRYADMHWSAERYAQWIMKWGVADYGGTANIDLAKVRNGDFGEINQWESGPHTVRQIGFSHTLPEYRSQQYYELIGKYTQFKYGWDTYERDSQGIPVSDGGDYNDWKNSYSQVTAYAKERGKANDFYYAATFAARLVLLNHIISMVDGFLSAKAYNNEISSSVGMRMQRVGNSQMLVSQLNIQIGF